MKRTAALFLVPVLTLSGHSLAAVKLGAAVFSCGEGAVASTAFEIDATGGRAVVD